VPHLPQSTAFPYTPRFRSEDERRQKCWLVDPAPNANAGERHDRGGQFLWQDDRPFALVIARARWALPRDKLDVGEHRLTVDSLRSEEHTSELQSRVDLVCR